MVKDGCFQLSPPLSGSFFQTIAQYMQEKTSKKRLKFAISRAKDEQS